MHSRFIMILVITVAIIGKIMQERRAQLKQLFDKEWKGYEAELHSMGLAIHKERI